MVSPSLDTTALPSPRKRWLLLAIFTALWIVEAVATHIPLPKLPPAAPSDKTLHFAAYFVLATALLPALWAQGRSLKQRIILCILILAAWGAVDEITQPLVNRHASALDWLADVGGVLIAVAVHTVIVLLHRRRVS